MKGAIVSALFVLGMTAVMAGTGEPDLVNLPIDPEVFAEAFGKVMHTLTGHHSKSPLKYIMIGRCVELIGKQKMEHMEPVESTTPLPSRRDLVELLERVLLARHKRGSSVGGPPMGGGGGGPPMGGGGGGPPMGGGAGGGGGGGGPPMGGGAGGGSMGGGSMGGGSMGGGSMGGGSMGGGSMGGGSVGEGSGTGGAGAGGTGEGLGGSGGGQMGGEMGGEMGGQTGEGATVPPMGVRQMEVPVDDLVFAVCNHIIETAKEQFLNAGAP